MIRVWTGLLLAVLAAPAQALPPQPYSCGPFLLQPGLDQMSVVVDHETPVTAVLTYRRADARGAEKAVRHDRPRRHHLFVLEDLDPGTEYRYEVRSQEGLGSGPCRFRSLPEAPNTYRVVVVGDLRSQPEVWHQVSQRILAQEGDALFLIGTGDYPADGRKYSQWVAQVFAPGRDLLARLPLWPALGNHERPRPDTKPPTDDDTQFFRLFDLPSNERWYRVDYQHLTLLVLDSTWQLRPGSGQYEWLVDQLRSERGRFTVVVHHHPPFTSGPHGQLQPDDAPREEPIDQARRFLVPLFEMHGVSLVLSGHDHFYERSEKEDIVYAVIGGGGAPLYKIGSVDNPYQRHGASVHHYAVLQIEPNRLSMQAVDVDGQVFDRVEIPLSRQVVRRRNAAVAQQLEQAVRFGPADAQRRTLAVTLANPLAVPLEVEIRVAEGQADLGPQSRLTLAPNGSQQVELAVGNLIPATEPPSWQAGPVTPLEVRFRGDDDGLPIEVAIARPALLREPMYRARRMVPPQVDGDLSEWQDLPPMAVDSRFPAVLNPQSYQGDRDLRALVRLGWSDEHLYLAVQVRDDVLMDQAQDAVWNNDSVELYFDGRPDSARTGQYAEWVSQSILPAVRSAGERLEGNRSWPAGALAWKVRRQPDGYCLEASVPHRLYQQDGAAVPGGSVHFDLMLNDRDAPDQVPSHHRLWSTGPAASDPSGFGRIVLTE